MLYREIHSIFELIENFERACTVVWLLHESNVTSKTADFDRWYSFREGFTRRTFPTRYTSYRLYGANGEKWRVRLRAESMWILIFNFRTSINSPSCQLGGRVRLRWPSSRSVFCDQMARMRIWERGVRQADGVTNYMSAKLVRCCFSSRVSMKSLRCFFTSFHYDPYRKAPFNHCDFFEKNYWRK